MNELATRIEAERERLRAKYARRPGPPMAAAELDRRARVRVCFPRGSRRVWAVKLGIKTDTLNNICQGKYFASYELAVRMCEHYPETLTINDLVRVRAPKGIRLYRSDEARQAA